MKAALFVLLSIAAALPTQAAFGNGYSFRRAIVIDHTKVPNTDQTNFTVLVSSTYSYLATVANGGLVQNASGFDIIFTSDLAGTTAIPYERERYIATTGEVDFWVNVATVATAADTTIYMFYGNASISTDQSNHTGAWNSAYKAVYHFPDGTTLSTADSTSNANNATNTGATADALPGIIDGAAQFNSGNSARMTVPNNAGLNVTNLTVECWIRFFGALPSSFGEIIRKGNPWFLFMNGSNTLGLAINGDFASAAFFTPSPSTYYHIVGTYTDATKNVSLYVNGALVNSRTTATNLSPDATDMWIGANESLSQFLSAHLDEVRVSNVARPADWIATEYNSESSPSTFYTVGSQTTSGGGTTGSLILL